MTPDQIALRQSILESRPRTGLSGPFGPWLAVPSIARPSQELGRVVRYETGLSRRESELIILLTGAKFKSEAEFDIHVGEAMRAGIGMDVINNIPRGALLSQERSKEGQDDDVEFSLENVKKNMIPHLEKEIANVGKGDLQRDVQIVLFTAELLERSAVSDETYATTTKILGGDESLVKIVAIVGYYAYVAYTLNVFRIASSAS
jgi:4-carboxymuconolactone decarboxylase